MIKDHRWGLVLAGGGGKGAYQIGVLQAMDELGILEQVDVISGSSIGALNALLLTQKDKKKRNAIWDSIGVEQVFSTESEKEDLFDELRRVFSSITEYIGSATLQEYLKLGRTEGICSRNGLLEIIEKNIDFQQVFDYEKEIIVTIAKMENGTPKAEYISLRGKTKEEIIALVLASSALPVIYDAQEIDGVLYRDGGIADNVPRKPILDKGLDHLFVIQHTHGKTALSKIEDGKGHEILIRPSHDIGEFLDGTIDFSKDGICYRKVLGYYDGLCIFNEQKRIEEGRGSQPIDFQLQMLENHERAKSECKKNQLEDQVAKHLQEFQKYEHYYDK